jgi:transcriptional regulator with GAF, ATPase, and Fis domain
MRRLLPRILDAAIEITEAERGFLVRVTGRKPSGGYKVRVEVARGFDRATLKGAQGSVSRTVVQRVLQDVPDGLVTTSAEHQDLLDVSSVRDRRVLSVVCVPLKLRGDMRGVIYLDHRFDRQAFTDRDLPILRTFADQAALALETAELLDVRARGEDRLGETLRQLEGTTLDESGDAVQAPGPRLSRFGGLVGSSEAMQRLYREIERASRSWDPVLILGESGTGKELVAREIHTRGDHRDKSFLSENCAAVAEGVLESELFGHQRGSFTGATSDRQGLFEQAGRGTLLLDEVGDMSATMQGKLLRVLQEGCVRPVGGDRQIPVHCRVLAATHRDLRELVRAGKFREDLYYRLDVLRIEVPALRMRPEDIPLLLEHYFTAMGRPGLKMTKRARELLMAYSWPGNVRELENEVRRLVAKQIPRIRGSDLSEEIQKGRGVARAPGNLSGKTLNEVGREMIAAALRDAGGNKSRAARMLGIPRSTLYHLISRHGL